MGNVPYWEDDPESWDRLIIGNQVVPGVWDVEDGSGKRIIDIKKGLGRDGATIKDKGYENGAVSLVGQIGDLETGAEQWLKLQSIIDDLRVLARGKQQSPTVIDHPKLVVVGISKVYFTEVSVPQINNGVMTLRLHAVEWTQPKKTGGAKKKTTSTLSNEFLDKNFNAVTAGQELRAEEARAQQELLKRQAEEAQERAEWPNFDSTAPQFNPRVE